MHQSDTQDLLRFVTAGSVDDGKSTLIGQLLVKSHAVFADQLDAVRAVSSYHGSSDSGIDLALITDGLRAEREQGITIDVAYRYFSTRRRKFIIADTPGHEQYTRNMATGASTADLAIILIDASQGVVTQARRHSFIASLLGISHFVIAVNKMDLVDFSQDAFRRVVTDYTVFSSKLQVSDVTFIPLSALHGDNIASRSDRMQWYDGPTLLGHLEQVHIASDLNLIDMRFPVQLVHRPVDGYRRYLGTVVSGVIKADQDIVVLPAGTKGRIKSVFGLDGTDVEGTPSMPVSVSLHDQLDISRGDVIVPMNNVPRVGRRFDAMVVWMSEDPMAINRRYVIKHSCATVSATIRTVRYSVNVDTLHREPRQSLTLNQIGRCYIETDRPIVFEAYRRNRRFGSFIIIDRQTHGTIGAGMMLEQEPSEDYVHEYRTTVHPLSEKVYPHSSLVSMSERIAHFRQNPATVWLTGLTGSGKTTIAVALERRLFAQGMTAVVLDGSTLRLNVNRDLGFSGDDRAEHVRRTAEIARMLNEAGLVAICALISPHAQERGRARRIVGASRFIEIYLSASLQSREKRASHDLYDRAKRGDVEHFSGITAPFEPPMDPDLLLVTDEMDVAMCVDRIMSLMAARGVFLDA